MLPDFLVPETLTRENGSGPEVELGRASGQQLLLTLGITRIIEQESLDVDIWGSADRVTWSEKPLLRFPQKFYCGTYCMLLDLTKQAETKFLRVTFKAARWGRGDATPLFGFYVFAQEAAQAVVSHAAVA